MQTPTDINAVIAASDNKLIIIDFWAEWCEPCKSLTPILEKIVSELANQVSLVKIDTDSEPELAGQLGVQSLPTLIFVKDRKLVDQLVGLQSEGAIRAAINKHVVAQPSSANDNIKESANQLIFNGAFDEAANLLSQAVVNDPTNTELRFMLIDALAGTGNLALAKEQMAQIPSEQQRGNDYVRAKTRIELVERNLDGTSPAQAAMLKLLNGGGESAMQELLDLTKDGDEEAKTLLLEAFKLYGNSGPIVNKYRSQLMTYLN